MLFPVLGDMIARRLDRAWVRRTIAGSAAAVLLATTAISAQIQFDWAGGTLGKFMRTDPTAEGLDWTSIRDDLVARSLLPPHALVAALNWRDAGKIGYAVGSDATILCLSADSRQFAYADPSGDYAGQDVLLLVVDRPPRAAEEARRWFETIDILAPTSVRLTGRVLRTVTVLRGHDLRPPP
jgi:hypothetical protein